jgi:DNA (cytosine-5)-methyltransferase 1
MNELSLFSGAGGGLLATKWLLGWRTIGYVEWNDYCQRVLTQRIKDGFLDDAPIFGDIREFNRTYAREYQGVVDVITAGFPCQPFSVAGKQQGEDDPRNQWPNTIECVRLIRPRYVFLENVSNLLTHEYIRRIFGDLAQAGYDAEWCVLGASDVGANHRRKRLWILAYSNKRRLYASRQEPKQKDNRRQTSRIERCDEDMAHALHDEPHRPPGHEAEQVRHGAENRVSLGNGEDVVHPNSDRFSEQTLTKKKTKSIGWTERTSNQPSWWDVEPPLGRVAHGVAHRVDRLKAIGNGQVPAVVKVVWELLKP